MPAYILTCTTKNDDLGSMAPLARYIETLLSKNWFPDIRSHISAAPFNIEVKRTLYMVAKEVDL